MNTRPLDSSGERVILSATELRPSEKLLLLRVNTLHRITERRRGTDGRQGCFATAARLAEDLGVSERHIGTRRARLEPAGLLVHWRGHRCVSWAVTLPEGCTPRSGDADDILRARIRLDEHLVRVRGTIRRARPTVTPPTPGAVDSAVTPPTNGATTEALTPSPPGAVTEPAASGNPADEGTVTPPTDCTPCSREEGGGRRERVRSIPSSLPPPSENGRERTQEVVTHETEPERAGDTEHCDAGAARAFEQMERDLRLRMEANRARREAEAAGAAGGRSPPARTG